LPKGGDPRRIELRTIARPIGVARVVLSTESSGNRSLVTFFEEPEEGTRMYALRRFIDPFLHLRNIEALRRLERVVRIKCSGARSGATCAGGLLRPRNERPESGPDEIVEATGKVGEAFEWIERARGRLYDFHQMIGRASCSRTRSTFGIRRIRRNSPISYAKRSSGATCSMGAGRTRSSRSSTISITDPSRMPSGASATS
jgi:hypothetical protein